MKNCISCKKNKDLSMFYTRVENKNQKRSQCKECFNKKVKDNFRKRKYGITPIELSDMWEKQNGKCIICSRGARVIDHDHKTGKARGLLCHRCNTGLGFFNDSSYLLNNAAEYLK